MTDRIFYRGMVFFTRHGVYAAERELGQRLEVDLDCHMDVTPWSRGDEFEKAVSYTDIYAIVQDVAEGRPVGMIETVAERIADALLARIDRIEAVRVEVRKPSAPVPGVFETVGVDIFRRRREDPA